MYDQPHDQKPGYPPFVYSYQLHEQRITVVEKAVEDLAETTKRLELLAARAVGGIGVLMLLQPVVTGLLLYYLTNK